MAKTCIFRSHICLNWTSRSFDELFIDKCFISLCFVIFYWKKFRNCLVICGHLGNYCSDRCCAVCIFSCFKYVNSISIKSRKIDVYHIRLFFVKFLIRKFHILADPIGPNTPRHCVSCSVSGENSISAQNGYNLFPPLIFRENRMPWRPRFSGMSGFQYRTIAPAPPNIRNRSRVVHETWI